MTKILRYITVIVVALAVAVLAWVGHDVWRHRNDAAPDRHERMAPARIADIRSMVRLCTVEIYEEVPVRASIGKRHLFARQVLVGEVSFDIEHIDTVMSGDTLVVTLPQEIVEVREATVPDAYTVIDTWSDSFMGGGDFTAAEENAIKRRVVDMAVDRVYRRGLVRQARRDATSALASMLAAVLRRPVKVIDPTPAGTRPIGRSR